METHFRISVCVHKSAQKANSNLSLKQKYNRTAPSTAIFACMYGYVRCVSDTICAPRIYNPNVGIEKL